MALRLTPLESETVRLIKFSSGEKTVSRCFAEECLWNLTSRKSLVKISGPHVCIMKFSAVHIPCNFVLITVLKAL